MIAVRVLVCVVVTTLLGCAPAGKARPGGPPDRSDAPLRVGFAEANITPPLGYPVSGYGLVRKRLATAERDPLMAKAVVFAQGTTQAALVEADLTSVSRAVTDKARAAAATRTGIPVANIVIAATHTHTGAELDPGGHPFDYPTTLHDRLVDVIAAAQRNLLPADLHAGFATQSPTISFHRRHRYKDGRVRSLGPPQSIEPGHDPADVVSAMGPIDNNVGMVVVRDPGKDTPRGVLTVFALHPNTVGNTIVGEDVFSADYPYSLARAVQNAFGKDVVSLFATGTCGNINYFDPHTPKRRDHEELGRLLGNTVVAAAPTLPRADNAALAVRSVRLALPVRSFSAEQVTLARSDMQRFAQIDFLHRSEARTMVFLADWGSAPMPVEIQAIRVTRDLAIVTLPGEVFVEFGLAIKNASPFRTTLVVELANDNATSYIPTRAAHEDGGYEALLARLAPGGGERMVEESVRLLRELSAAP